MKTLKLLNMVIHGTSVQLITKKIIQGDFRSKMVLVFLSSAFIGAKLTDICRIGEELLASAI